MKNWNIYARFKAPCGFSSWHRITPNTDTFDGARKLLQDLEGSFGAELCLNK